jgi:hypothetical protein
MDTDAQGPGLATGLLLALVGAWIVSRTVVHDAQGQNLVDRIVAYATGSGSSTSSGKSKGGALKLPFGFSASLPKSPFNPAFTLTTPGGFRIHESPLIPSLPSIDTGGPSPHVSTPGFGPLPQLTIPLP